MTHYRTAPTYDQDILTGNTGAKTTASWYRFFQDIDQGTPPSNEIPIIVTASPFIYSPKMKGVLIVSGGTVSSIAISRTPGTFYPTGQTSGAFTLAANDQVKVTYSVVPSMVFLPS